MKKLFLSLTFFLALTACNGLTPETPEEQLAVAEKTFQGVQDTLQTLARVGVITQDIAPCVSDANSALHGGLVQARNAVKLGMSSAATIVSAFNAALLNVKDILVQVEGGTYSCKLQ